MNAMTMPGFTAEAALYQRSKPYQLSIDEAEQTSGQGIIPQMMRVFRSGRLTLICHYDDASGELGYCDVYF